MWGGGAGCGIDGIPWNSTNSCQLPMASLGFWQKVKTVQKWCFRWFLHVPQGHEESGPQFRWSWQEMPERAFSREKAISVISGRSDNIDLKRKVYGMQSKESTFLRKWSVLSKLITFCLPTCVIASSGCYPSTPRALSYSALAPMRERRGFHILLLEGCGILCGGLRVCLAHPPLPSRK